MDITPNNLAFFFSQMNTMYQQGFANPVAPVYYDKIATTIPSQTEQNVYGWIGMIDKMREWVGSRTTRTPAPETYVVFNQPYELTEEVDKFKLQDDTWGIYYQLFKMMGDQARKWPDYQLRDLLQNIGTQVGTRQNGLDGLTHWNQAHPIDIYDSSKGTYSNDFTSGGFTVNGVNVGGPLTVNGFATLWEEFAARKSQSGEPFGLMPNLVTVPTQLKVPAMTILQAQFFGAPVIGSLGTAAGGQPNAPMVGSTENMLRGWTDLLIVPELGITNSTAVSVWYMFATQMGVKPFTFQQRQAANMVYRTNEQDPVVFDKHKYVYGVDARGAVAWSHAFLSARSGP